MRNPRRRITLDMAALQETFRLSWFGIGYGRTMSKTGLSKGQVGYRRRMFQQKLGMTEGFCRRWMLGHHPLQNRMMRDYSAIAIAEFERKFLPTIIHPEPKTVRVPNEK